MAFIDKYVGAVNSSNLIDDDTHHITDALAAAALSDLAGAGIGSLFSRAKYANGTPHKLFESGTHGLAQLLRIWTCIVTEKGRSRGWAPVPRTSWDIEAVRVLYARIAAASLAHWMGMPGIIAGGRFESDKVRDMISELEGLTQAHNARAAGMLRRVA